MTWSLNKIINFRVLSLINFLTLMLIGGCAMSANIEYKWEWPADRAIEDRVLVQIKSLKKKGAGLFGINMSPSLVSNLPDPYILSGIVLNSPNKLAGKTVQVVVPSAEIDAIKTDSLAMFGIVENNICICIVPVENKASDLNSINCP